MLAQLFPKVEIYLMIFLSPSGTSLPNYHNSAISKRPRVKRVALLPGIAG